MTQATQKPMRLLSMFSEILPLVVLAVGNSLYDIFVGASAAVIASAVILGITWWWEARVARFALFSVVISTGFTLAALYFGESLFIKIQPSLFNGLFSFVLLAGWLSGRAVMKDFFGAQFHLTDAVWTTLSMRWGFMFLLLTLGNEWAWRALSDDGWVAYKVFFAAPATALFMLAQLPITIKGTKDAKKEAQI